MQSVGEHLANFLSHLCDQGLSAFILILPAILTDKNRWLRLNQQEGRQDDSYCLVKQTNLGNDWHNHVEDHCFGEGIGNSGHNVCDLCSVVYKLRKSGKLEIGFITFVSVCWRRFTSHPSLLQI